MRRLSVARQRWLQIIEGLQPAEADPKREQRREIGTLKVFQIGASGRLFNDRHGVVTTAVCLVNLVVDILVDKLNTPVAHQKVRSCGVI